MTAGLAPGVVERAFRDARYFAERIVGRPLWAHQLEAVESPARVKVIAAGRQVGKSVLVAVLVLWTVLRKPGALVLIVSAKEDGAKRLLAECLSMAKGSPFIRSSLVEEGTLVVTFSNGSEIRAVAASEKAIRGWPVDLLVIDEAGFVAQEIWEAAEPGIIARPGSQVILTSSPFGGPGHFFRSMWNLGTAGDPMVAAWRWPSMVSPVVDAEYVEGMRRRWPADRFAREILAEWGASSGTYFDDDELLAAVADYQLIPPERAADASVVGGVDWGYRNDSNTLALIGVLADGAEAEDQPVPAECVYFVTWLEEHKRMLYSDFVDRVVDVARPAPADGHGRRSAPGAYKVEALASETNGVGEAPTQLLQQRAAKARTEMAVFPVHTSNKRKQDGFGALRLLLAQGRLVLPRDPELLKQLASLTFETTDVGNVRISVPDNLGHDDLAMALMQAASCLRLNDEYTGRPDFASGSGGHGELLTTGRGTRIRERPRIAYYPRAFVYPQGHDEDGW